MFIYELSDSGFESRCSSYLIYESFNLFFFQDTKTLKKTFFDGKIIQSLDAVELLEITLDKKFETAYAKYLSQSK